MSDFFMCEDSWKKDFGTYEERMTWKIKEQLETQNRILLEAKEKAKEEEEEKWRSEHPIKPYYLTPIQQIEMEIEQEKELQAQQNIQTKNSNFNGFKTLLTICVIGSFVLSVVFFACK